MTLKVQTSLGSPGALSRRTERGTVVIVDSGDSAAVIVVDSVQSLDVGSRFRHGGITWQITGRRPYSRALIASPIHV